MTKDTHTKWFYSRQEDSEFWFGGSSTREEAIAQGRGDFDDSEEFWICAASNPPIRLADWIGAEQLIKRAAEKLADSDRTHSEADEDANFFNVSAEQGSDLVKRIQTACDEWQAAHGLVFTVQTFTDFDRFEAVPALIEPQE